MPTPLTWGMPGLTWNQPGLTWNGNLPEATLMSEMYRLTGAILPATKTAGLAGIQTSRDAITFLITATAKENKDLFTLGPEWLPYVAAFVARANAKPALLPAHVILAKVNESQKIWDDMTDYENLLVDFLGRVRATKILAGAQILASGLDTQKNVETLSKRDVPDAREFFEALKAVTPAKGRPKKTTPA